MPRRLIRGFLDIRLDLAKIMADSVIEIPSDVSRHYQSLAVFLLYMASRAINLQMGGYLIRLTQPEVRIILENWAVWSRRFRLVRLPSTHLVAVQLAV